MERASKNLFFHFHPGNVCIYHRKAYDDCLGLGLALFQKLFLLVRHLLLPGLGGQLLVGPALGHALLLLLGVAGGVGADGGVRFLIHGLHTVGVDSQLDVSGNRTRNNYNQ